MSAGLIWSNVLAYSLQVGLVVGLGAIVPTVLRMRMPRARLVFWQCLLAACLILPWLRTWRHEVLNGALIVSGMAQVGSTVTAVTGAGPVARSIPFTAIALWLLAAGIAIRLGFLIAGLLRLRLYRRRGEEMPRELRIPGTPDRIEILLSEDIAGPVTFGWRSPVILLPVDFPPLDAKMRDAILCHELMHVERRDWLFTIAEELLRSILWFHPAVWWVIGEIQLAREQSVDESVIETTRARGPYVDALLLMAGADPTQQTDLAPAPMFLRKRHLKRRLMEMVSEVRMAKASQTQTACLLGTAILTVAGACWLATGAFPLAAAPQVVNDASGVTVNMAGGALMHRSAVPYPVEALAKGIEGTVVVQVRLDENGEVDDAAVLSGPNELRKAVLQSVLNWHFQKSGTSTQTVSIRFVKPAGTPMPTPVPSFRATSSPGPPRTFTIGKIERMEVTGLPDEQKNELLSRLTIHAGDNWTPGALTETARIAKSFDSHLTTTLARNSRGGFEIRIDAPAVAPPPPPPTEGIFSVGNGTLPPTLISKVEPQYTEEARTAKYDGSVMLAVVVGADGKAEDIRILKPLGMGLDEKAIEAVRQWVFRPGTNQGVPVRVRAQIEVNFRLL